MSIKRIRFNWFKCIIKVEWIFKFGLYKYLLCVAKKKHRRTSDF